MTAVPSRHDHKVWALTANCDRNISYLRSRDKKLWKPQANKQLIMPVCMG